MYTPLPAGRQTDFNEKMRSILVAWLVDVQLKFKLLPETLFLCIDIMDRYSCSCQRSVKGSFKCSASSSSIWLGL